MAYLNYTLKFAPSIIDEVGIRLMRYMRQFLDKSNIDFEKCASTTCTNMEDLDVIFSQYETDDILLLISCNYTCDFSGSVRAEILSASPISSKSLTTDILKIDAVVLTLLSVGGVFCAAISAMMSKPKSEKLKSIFYPWLKNIWINFSLLFSESANRLPSSLKARTVLTTWLFTALLITIEVGSYLKSSFAVTTYDFIDRYQDTFKYDNVEFLMDSFNPVRAVKCSEREWEDYSKACGKLNMPGPFDGDISLSVPENTLDHKGIKKILIITTTDLKREIRFKFNEIRQSGRLFYLGQSPVEVLLHIATKDVFRQNQFLTEKIMKGLLVIFETNCWVYEEFEGDYMLESVLWKRPNEEGTELYLDDSLLVFNFWVIGMTVSVIVFLLEVCSHFSLLQFNKKNRPRNTNQIE